MSIILYASRIVIHKLILIALYKKVTYNIYKVKKLHFTTAPMLSNKAYEMLWINRPYKTEVRLCDCYSQECKGRYLTKVGSHQTVCLFELQRLNYQNNITPVMEIREKRIKI